MLSLNGQMFFISVKSDFSIFFFCCSVPLMSDPRNRCHESNKSVQCHEAFPLASFGSFVAFVLHLGVWFGLSLFVYIWYEVRVHFTLACMSLTSSGCLAMLFHWRLS